MLSIIGSHRETINGGTATLATDDVYKTTLTRYKIIRFSSPSFFFPFRCHFQPNLIKFSISSVGRAKRRNSREKWKRRWLCCCVLFPARVDEGSFQNIKKNKTKKQKKKNKSKKQIRVLFPFLLFFYYFLVIIFWVEEFYNISRKDSSVMLKCREYCQLLSVASIISALTILTFIEIKVQSNVTYQQLPPEL